MWPWLWLAWMLGGTALELAAIYGKRAPQDTLSRNIQAIVLHNAVIQQVTIAGWVVFSAWFAVHIWG